MLPGFRFAILQQLSGNSDEVVGWTTEEQEFDFRQGKGLFCYSQNADQLWGPARLLSKEDRGPFSRDRGARHKATDSPASRVKVNVT
jgi:hypothetical protein